MRQIEVDIDVFAAIWAQRRHNETDENGILRRILLGVGQESKALTGEPNCSEAGHFGESKEVKTSNSQFDSPKVMESLNSTRELEVGKIRWVDDVQTALKALGGRASLQRIYDTVERRRREAGRSVPKTLDAVIRRTLEDHSSDSANFRGNDLFALLGRGEWGLR